MVCGKARAYSMQNILLQTSSWQSIIVGANKPKGLGGRYMHTLKRKVKKPLSWSVQYVGRADCLFEVQVAMWNIGSLSGNGRQVCKVLKEDD